MIKLGVKCRDSVSGWEGVATARYEYMNGCVRYELSASDKDGKPQAFVFDEEQVSVIDVTTVEKTPATKTGGDRGSAPVAR